MRAKKGGDETMERVQRLLDEACTSSLSGQELTVTECRRLASLWSSYGVVLGVKAVDQDGKENSYVVKQVAPPSGSGISHERKLHSYQVEAYFYERLASEAHAAGADCHLPRALVEHNALGPGGGSLELLLTDLRPRFPTPAASCMDEAHAKAALTWLAAFHALFWERPAPPEIWEEGCYWHLATRQEELRAMSWPELQAAAAEVDRRLRSGAPTASGAAAFRTLVHGDFKAANICFGRGDRDGELVCAAYDFQYCGGGYGVKDVVYLLCSSVQASVVQRQEADLLGHYHSELLARLPDGARERYTFKVLQEHYNLAVLDYVRFMEGWGYWGACSSLYTRRAKELLPRLDLAG